MVMTAGAGRGERLQKSAEQLKATDGGADDDLGTETEFYFPEERTQMRNHSSALESAKYLYGNREGVKDAFTTERTRFQRISVASYSSSHEATSPKSVTFRTRF